MGVTEADPNRHLWAENEINISHCHFVIQLDEMTEDSFNLRQKTLHFPEARDSQLEN